MLIPYFNVNVFSSKREVAYFAATSLLTIFAASYLVAALSSIFSLAIFSAIFYLLVGTLFAGAAVWSLDNVHEIMSDTEIEEQLTETEKMPEWLKNILKNDFFSIKTYLSWKLAAGLIVLSIPFQAFLFGGLIANLILTLPLMFATFAIIRGVNNIKQVDEYGETKYHLKNTLAANLLRQETMSSSWETLLGTANDKIKGWTGGYVDIAGTYNRWFGAGERLGNAREQAYESVTTKYKSRSFKNKWLTKAGWADWWNRATSVEQALVQKQALIQRANDLDIQNAPGGLDDLNNEQLQERINTERTKLENQAQDLGVEKNDDQKSYADMKDAELREKVETAEEEADRKAAEQDQQRKQQADAAEQRKQQADAGQTANNFPTEGMTKAEIQANPYLTAALDKLPLKAAPDVENLLVGNKKIKFTTRRNCMDCNQRFNSWGEHLSRVTDLSTKHRPSTRMHCTDHNWSNANNYICPICYDHNPQEFQKAAYARGAWDSTYCLECYITSGPTGELVPSEEDTQGNFIGKCKKTHDEFQPKKLPVGFKGLTYCTVCDVQVKADQWADHMKNAAAIKKHTEAWQKGKKINIEYCAKCDAHGSIPVSSTDRNADVKACYICMNSSEIKDKTGLVGNFLSGYCQPCYVRTAIQGKPLTDQAVKLDAHKKCPQAAHHETRLTEKDFEKSGHCQDCYAEGIVNGKTESKDLVVKKAACTKDDHNKGSDDKPSYCLDCAYSTQVTTTVVCTTDGCDTKGKSYHYTTTKQCAKSCRGKIQDGSRKGETCGQQLLPEDAAPVYVKERKVLRGVNFTTWDNVKKDDKDQPIDAVCPVAAAKDGKLECQACGEEVEFDQPDTKMAVCTFCRDNFFREHYFGQAA